MSKTIYSVLRVVAAAIVVWCSAADSKAQRIAPSPHPSNENIVSHVRTWSAVKPDTNKLHFGTQVDLSTARMSTNYFDGLGRLVQTTRKQEALATGDTAIDQVVPVFYDEFSREPYTYLPFAANHTGGLIATNDGSFKINPFQQDSSFCKAQYPGESWFYGQKVYESSVLDRIQETFVPGNNWVGTSGQAQEANRHSIKSKYWFNRTADSVRIWSVSDVPGQFGSYTTSAFYPAGKLLKTISIDEHGRQVIEFEDPEENMIVLRKVQLTASADTGSGKGYSGWLSTYYIYDSLTQLRCVVQPVGVELLQANSWDITSLNGDILSEQCFRYEYDYQGRKIMQKVPGAGVVWMVYDSRDRVVLSQDSSLRAARKWLYTQYENYLNRPIATGLLTDNSNYNNLGYHALRADTSYNYPNLGDYSSEELTRTFYDDYSWLSEYSNPLTDTYDNSWDSHLLTASNTTWPYPQANSQSAQIRGFVTGKRTKVLGSSAYLYSVIFYDEEGRVIQTQATNITGGTDVATNQYSWNGKLVLSIQKQEKADANSQTIVSITKPTYDDLWRVLKVEHKISHSQINGGAMPSSWTTLVENEYDKAGRLVNKKLAPGYNNGAGLESMAYDYNIQDWIVGMNRSFINNSSNHYFGFELGYDRTATTIEGSSFGTALYDGNVAGMLWRSTGDKERRKYDFGYDAVSRLLFADFTQYTDDSFNKTADIDFSVKMGNGLNPDSAYDANGNIRRMQQWGLKAFSSSLIDDLRYTYNAGTNKLKNVIDITNDTDTKLGDFKSSAAYMTVLSDNKTSSAIDYDYDGNGNMVKDLNKDISCDTADAIEYNHLNLPVKIRVKDKGIIEYIYDADGSKLKKITKETGKPDKTTLYMGAAIYENDTLQFINHQEGRIRTKADSLIVYDYFIKDHLENVRALLTTEIKTDAYHAGLETTNRSVEEQLFMEIGTTEFNKPAGFDSDTSNHKVSRLLGTASTDHRVGPGVVLKVMAGDKFRVGVNGWYQPGVTNPNTASELDNIVNSLIDAFTGGLPAGGNHGQGSGSIPGSTELTTPFQAFVTNFNGPNINAVPRAYLNWITLDEEQFKLVEGNYGAIPMPEIVDPMEKQAMVANGGEDIEVKKNGYLYVYVCNESKGSVYFDELSVTHTRGPLLEETHYYPFGLTMSGISSKALVFGGSENKKNKFQNQELNNDLDVNYYEFKWRNHDPQIGRFIQIDPLSKDYDYNSTYAFSENKVTGHVELEGLESKRSIGQGIINGGKNFLISLVKPVYYESLKSAAQGDWKGAANNALPTVSLGAAAINTTTAFIEGDNQTRAEIATETGLNLALGALLGKASTTPQVKVGTKVRVPEAIPPGVVAPEIVTETTAPKTTAPKTTAAKTTAPIAQASTKPTPQVPITKPYKRPSGSTTPQQRASVQGQSCVKCGGTSTPMVAGHKEALVKEYYETGTIDKTKMRDPNAVQPECATCSAREGAERAQYSKEQKKIHGL